ncbi:MAG TPA: histidine kinase [Candidatus Limnocylindrales bacterium]|nr:histidine kinase [Candidatus Limnocylindrales bacterium]
MVERWIRGVHWTDVGLAIGLTAVGVSATLTAEDYTGGRARLTAALLLQTLPLVWRRSAPLRAVSLSALGVAIEVAGAAAWGDVAGFFGYLVLAYSVPRWGQRRDRLVAGAILGAGFVVHLTSQPHDGVSDVIGSMVSASIMTAAAWALGTAMRSRSERVHALEEDVTEMERRWADERRAVIEEERRRIARDLHDIVGHALAAISLSAGGAEQCLDASEGDSPGIVETRLALNSIRTTSRDAAADVRRLVGLLRTENDVNQVSPQPTLAGVPQLVGRARSAGLDVELADGDNLAGLPLGVQLALYRVVQEGLTNVTKHAPGSSVRVCIARRNGGVVAEIENSPPSGPPTPAVDRGHGLVGLAERVALYDGDLRGEPTTEGGFLLATRIPVS